MNRAVLGLLLAGLPAFAVAADKAESVSAGVTADFAAGKLIAVASCAADLYPPSADVARLKAERVARSRAEDKLRKALTVVARDHKAKLARFGGAERVAKLDVSTAVVERIEYGATSGVVLWLALPLATKADRGKEGATQESAVPDAGTGSGEEP
ncbi:MAG: hypothetical protein JNM40_15805 [Myxococcales bacterium]|nr:hypothetical protein [Myxococcales bacterium]